MSELSAALRFHLMFVGLLACLRAEPQVPLSMYDETELTTAMITSSHIALLKRRRIPSESLMVHKYR